MIKKKSTSVKKAAILVIVSVTVYVYDTIECSIQNARKICSNKKNNTF